MNTVVQMFYYFLLIPEMTDRKLLKGFVWFYQFLLPIFVGESLLLGAYV